MGCLQQEFEIKLQGIQLPDAREFHIRRQSLDARLEPGTPPRLFVHVHDAIQSQAEAVAARFVQELYLRLLLRFGANIESSARPRCIRQTFAPPTASSTGATASATLTLSVGATLASRALVVPSLTELDALVHDVELRTVTPQVATSAQLYSAIDMYAVALESQNKVVRFLVLYTALALAALFKWHSGRQGRVDELLVGANNQIPLSPSPRDQQQTETLYTKLRNDLIHAEERGADPARAIAAIESHIGEFQRDVCLVISHL